MAATQAQPAPKNRAAAAEIAPVAAAGGAGAQPERAQRMRQSLQALLDRVRGSRQAMPHLAALEQALAQRGPSALDNASQRTLSKIHTQLRVLPLDAADGAIQDLLAMVRQALRNHASRETHQLSPFDPESTVVIIESTHSEFIDALGDAHAKSRG